MSDVCRADDGRHYCNECEDSGVIPVGEFVDGDDCPNCDGDPLNALPHDRRPHPPDYDCPECSTDDPECPMCFGTNTVLVREGQHESISYETADFIGCKDCNEMWRISRLDEYVTIADEANRLHDELTELSRLLQLEFVRVITKLPYFEREMFVVCEHEVSDD